MVRKPDTLHNRPASMLNVVDSRGAGTLAGGSGRR
jgi:hypothetical protein